MRAILVTMPEHDTGWFRPTAPLQLAVWAAALLAGGADVCVLDLTPPIDLDRVAAWWRSQDYGLAFLAGINEQCDYVRWLSRLHAEWRPEVPCLIGGPLALSLRSQLLDYSLADGLVLDSRPGVLQDAAAMTAAGQPLASVPGVLARGAGQPTARPVGMPPPAAWYRPAWDQLPVQRYLQHRYRRGLRHVDHALPLQVGVGCPAACPHCGCPDSSTVRFREPSEVLAEADWLHEHFGVRHLMLRGPLLPQQPAVLGPLLQGLTQRPHLTWELRTRADLLAAKQVPELQAAGCLAVEYAPQALAEGECEEETRATVAATLQAHVRAGLPFTLRRLLPDYEGEPPPVAPELAQLLSHSDDVAAVPQHYYPGTPAYDAWMRSRRHPTWPPLLEFHAFKTGESLAYTPPGERTAGQMHELAYRWQHFPGRAATPPPLQAPRVLIVANAHPFSVRLGISRIEDEYPDGTFAVAASARTARELAWYQGPRRQVIAHDQGMRHFLQQVRELRPQLTVLITDETSLPNLNAKRLALLSGARHRLVYDAATDRFIGYWREYGRRILARWGFSPRAAADGQTLLPPGRSPLDHATDRVFPQAVTEERRLQYVARYEFARRFVEVADRVLDCGCTCGYGAELLAAGGATVTGLDPSPEMVRSAARRYGRDGLDFQHYSGRRLPFPDDTFDVATCFRTLERAGDPSALLEELARVLKPDGILLSATACTPPPDTAFGWRGRTYSRDELRALLAPCFQVRDLVEQIDGEVDWRLPAADFLVAQCDNAKGSGRSPRWRGYRPLVSVIMPCWNPGPYLQEALNSIFNQTLQDFELVVVDNGSTDGTTEKLRALAAEGKLRLVPLTENVGVSKALDIALAYSQGRYFARMDADDRSLSERLEKQVAYLEAHPDVCLVGSAAAMIDGEGKRTGEYYPIELTHQAIVKALETRCPIAHGSTMFRRWIVRTVGVYDFDDYSAEDYDLWIRVSRRHRVGMIDEVLFEYRAHAGQITQAAQRRHCTWRDAIRRRHFPDSSGRLSR